MKISEICRLLEINPTTYYKWQKGVHRVPKMAKVAAGVLMPKDDIPAFMRVSESGAVDTNR